MGQSGLGLMYMNGKGVSQVGLVIPFMIIVLLLCDRGEPIWDVG